MHNIDAVEVIDGLQDLAYDLGRILLGEFSILANTVKQFTTRRQLSNDIVFILSVPGKLTPLSHGAMDRCGKQILTNPRFEPIAKLDNMGMVELL